MRGAQEIAVYRKASPAVVLIRTKGGAVRAWCCRTAWSSPTARGRGIRDVQSFFKPPTQPGHRIDRISSGKVKYVDRQRDLAIIEVDNLPRDFKFLKDCRQ